MESIILKKNTALYFSGALLILYTIIINPIALAANPPPLSNPSTNNAPTLGPVFLGSLDGYEDTGSAGNASYTIPLEVPPGTHNMEPSLSLNYNSIQENSILGLGWHISGANSNISRCKQTVTQDGQSRAIDYTSADRFCLDGQRLIAINGSYGESGTVYRTESDIFSRIISYGAAGTGPAYFVVESKNGMKHFYGNTSDSRIESQNSSEVRLWALNRVEDASGNYYTINYREDTKNGIPYYYPTTINYTGNAGSSPVLAPYASVKFLYDSRADDHIKYEGGGAYYPYYKRLLTIETYHNSSRVRSYGLAYDGAGVGESQLSRLTQITSCDGSLSNCQTPVTLDWISYANTTFSESSLTVPNTNAQCMTKMDANAIAPRWHDLNGDGKPDYVHIVPPPSGNYEDSANLNFQILLSSNSGYQNQSWLSETAGYPKNLYWLDINGDSKTDVVGRKYRQTGNIFTFNVALSTGSNFSNHTWGGHEENTVYLKNGKSYPITKVSYQFADVSGDRLPDLIASEHFSVTRQYSTESYANVYVHLNTGNGFGQEQLWEDEVSTKENNVSIIDVNGDDRADLLEASDSKVYFRLSDGTSFGSAQLWKDDATNPSFGHYNNDNLLDMKARDENEGHYFSYLNTGENFDQNTSESYELPPYLRTPR